MTERILLQTFSTRYEAEAAISLLAGSSIDSLVVSDDCGSEDPALSFVRGVDLLVDPEDLERARRVILESAKTEGQD